MVLGRSSLSVATTELRGYKWKQFLLGSRLLESPAAQSSMLKVESGTLYLVLFSEICRWAVTNEKGREKKELI